MRFLAQSIPLQTRAANSVVKRNSPQLAGDRVAIAAGDEAKRMSAAQIRQDRRAPAISFGRALHSARATRGPHLIAGARRVLANLGGGSSSWLVTSGDRDRVTRQLREFRLTTLFAARVCSGDTLRKKPHPDPLRMAMRQMKLDPSACVYVGDAPQDVGWPGAPACVRLACSAPSPRKGVCARPVRSF